MIKKLVAYTLIAMMIVSIFTVKVHAKEINTTSLPVQFYDYDADGLFYEYALYRGMDTFGLKESNNGEVTEGLVENTLGEDGLPVYKQESVEAAAKTIQSNLALGKEDVLDGKEESERVHTTYKIFQYFMNIDSTTPSTQSYEGILGEENDPFYNNGWTLFDETKSSFHTGLGTIWEQETDGVVNYGINDHLTKTINVDENTNYTLDYYQENPLKIRILDQNNQVLLDDKKAQFNTQDNDKITIDIYKDNQKQQRGKIAKVKLTDEQGHEVYYLDDQENFINNGWVSTNYNDVTKDEQTGKLYDKESNHYWEQDGNGIKCIEDSSIVLDTNIQTNQMLKLTYWLDDTNKKESELSIDLLDENNNVLATKNVENKGGWNDCYLEASQGNGNIKLRINGKAGSVRIADLKVRQLGKVLALGNYQETVNKYNQGQLQKVEDCTSCMDYAYLRLKNYYNISNTQFNKKQDKYNKMILKEENTQKSGKLGYSFDSDKKIKYDENGTFYNENDEESDGFFPLDYVDGEKIAHGHNYNFGMIVDGDFIYKKGANQYFFFSGDDDVYVFINGKLAVDLGGAHTKQDATLCVEKYAEENGIKNGEKCTFKMFYLERHTDQSNCKIQTNLNIGKHAEYKFESATQGVELPEAILALTPIDENEYYKDQEVQINHKDKKFDDYEDRENNGVWKFEGWDETRKIMSESGVQFIGKWVFTANKVTKENEVIEPTDENKKETKDDNKQDQQEITSDNQKEQLDENKLNLKDEKQENNNQKEEQEVKKTLNNEEVKPTEKETSNIKIEANIKNEKSQKASQVKTGDTTTITLYLAMIIITLLGIVTLLRKNHKNNARE